MSTAEQVESGHETTTGSVLGAAPDVVEIRRNGGLAALIGAVASGIAIAYLGRAVQSGSVLDWALFAVLGAIAATWLHAFLDARTPLLVADAQGVRLRLGRAWQGLPWGALSVVEHTPRRGLLRDGKVVLVPHNPERVRDELDASGRRQGRVTEKLYGSPFAVPLGLSTRVPSLSEDLTTSLRALAGGATRVIEPDSAESESTDPDSVGTDEATGEPESRATFSFANPFARANGPRDEDGLREEDLREEDLRDEEADDEVVDDADIADEASDKEALGARVQGTLSSWKAGLAARIARRDEDSDAAFADADADADADTDADDTEPTRPLVASATPSPLRDITPASRIEIHSNLFVEGATARDTSDDETLRGLPEGRELRRPGSVPLVEDSTTWGDRVRPIATVKGNIEPLVLDDLAAEPAADPVIGPDLVAARTRIGLSVDTLAERTRIRPHVIESIEVDDFVPCGGDFYARGHLRTLARVLGLDSAPLLKAYDDRYADAPINPRRVFEADLATGSNGGIRSTRGGPNWSVLIAAIMTLVLAWSIARLVMDTPVELQSPAPILNGSGGPNQSAPVVESVTVKVTADGETHLVIRDANDKVVFDDYVAYGDVHRIDVLPPFQVQADDAGAVDVQVNGADKGALGADGKKSSKTYRVG